MPFIRFPWALAFLLLWVFVIPAQAADAPVKRKIVLVAGETAKIDVVGHHDYLAGCQCLEVLLRQSAGVETVWPRFGMWKAAWKGSLSNNNAGNNAGRSGRPPSRTMTVGS